MPTLYHQGILYMFNGNLFFKNNNKKDVDNDDDDKKEKRSVISIESNRILNNKLPSLLTNFIVSLIASFKTGDKSL